MFLLDTNVVSEVRKAGSGKADKNVIRWLSNADHGALFLSAMTLMEIELGIHLIGRRDDQQGARLRLWRDRYLLPEFSNRILPIDTAVALRCALLHVPDPCPERARPPRLFTV